MTFSEYKQKYSKLSQTVVRKMADSSSSEFSEEFKYATEELYEKAYKQKLNKSCSECWVDAYVLLIRLDAKKYESMESRQFDLKAGALLLDVVNGDNEKMVTRINLTDDLALYHLKTNPKCEDQFSVMPDNWNELVEAYELEREKETGESKTPAKKKTETK